MISGKSESRSRCWDHLSFLHDRVLTSSLFSIALNASGDGGLLSVAKGVVSGMPYLLAAIKNVLLVILMSFFPSDVEAATRVSVAFVKMMSRKAFQAAHGSSCQRCSH